MSDLAAQHNEDGAAPLLLVCDHASNYIPPEYGGLGLKDADLQRHIAWDIGALGMARRISDVLGAPLVYALASRLIIDCNRDPETAPDSIPVISEDTPIPGNVSISAADKARRIATIYEPYHGLIAEAVARQYMRCGPVSVLALHSFTPVYRGFVRPWDVGVIIGDGSGLAERLIENLRAAPGVNEPYSADDNVYHTLDRHGVAHGFPTAMIEVRQDHIGCEAGQIAWAERLVGVLRACLAF